MKLFPPDRFLTMRMWKWVYLILLLVLFAMFMFQHDVSANSDNWETLESRVLIKTGEFARREGNTLHLKLLDKNTIQLTDVPYDSKGNNAKYTIHRLVGYIEQHEYFVIGISHRTGLNGVLIDRKTGQRSELDGVAVFSPDNTRFFTVDFTHYPDSKYRMQIWKITPSGPALEWEFQPQLSAWSDVEAKWFGKGSIHIVRWERWVYGDDQKAQVRRARRESNIVQMFGRWQFIDLPSPPEPPSI